MPRSHPVILLKEIQRQRQRLAEQQRQFDAKLTKLESRLEQLKVAFDQAKAVGPVVASR